MLGPATTGVVFDDRTPLPPPATMASTYNATLLAHVVHACAANGLDRRLRTGIPVPVPGTEDGDGAVLRSCLRILADHGAVCEDDGRIRLTAAGADLFDASGYLTWLLGGYSPLLGALGDALNGKPSRTRRDEAMVALGSAQIDGAFLRSQIRSLLLRLAPQRVADLGCGDGSRLADYLACTTGTTGIGVDRAPAAVTLAAKRAADLGLGSRMTVVGGDCLAPLEDPDDGVEVSCVTAFFLLHDLLHARDGDLESVLTDLRHNYPNARRVLLADTTCDSWHGRYGEPPVFARGFELVHALMGVRLRTLAEYRALISSAPARLVDVVGLGVPNSWLFVVEPR